MDYKVWQRDDGRIVGQALTKRATAVYGKGEVVLNMDPSEFFDDFPSDWILGVLDHSGHLHIMTTNRLH